MLGPGEFMCVCLCARSLTLLKSFLACEDTQNQTIDVRKLFVDACMLGTCSFLIFFLPFLPSGCFQKERFILFTRIANAVA